VADGRCTVPGRRRASGRSCQDRRSVPAPDFVLEPVASFAAAAADWDALAAAVPSPFSTRAWAEAWWTAYGGGGEPDLRRVRTGDGRVAALLPLYRADRGPVRLLRFVGHGAADQLGPLCAPEDRPLAAAALRAAASELGPRGLLLAERLAGDEHLSEHLGGAVLREEASPVLATEGRTWDEWLAGKSKNFRDQARRMERRFAKAHDLQFRLADDPDRLEADMTTLFDLHDLRWASEGGSDAFDVDRRAFHQDLARRALAEGWLRLWIAEVDGTPGAAWYGFRRGDREWYYQLGRDPAWDRFKIGFVLLVHTIREAFADGASAYHFGLGPEPYKDRFATGDPRLHTVVVGRPNAVRAARGAVAGIQRLPPDLKRRLST
jgi:CelD/BcsL family acetyltransferase involved in cellulose biosynthesis